jgi:hypothetical protein
MTLESGTHLCHNVYTAYHCMEHCYIDQFQQVIYVLRSLVL